MRKIYGLLSILLVSVFIIFANCSKNGGGEDPLTSTQERAKALSEGSWGQSGTATVPTDVDPTILDNLTMVFGVSSDGKFTPDSFSSSGAPEFFTTASGSTWSLSGTDIVSLSGVEGGVSSFQISQFSDTQMTISFAYVTPAGRLAGGERIAGLDGNYTVTLGSP